MLNVKVKKKVDHTIITHRLVKHEQINSLELGMVKSGEMSSINGIEMIHGLFGNKLRYVVSGYIDIVSFLESGIDFKEFSILVQGIIKTVLDCESHGIRVGNLEMRPELIFYNYAEKRVKLLYWPLISLQEYTSERPLFQQLGAGYVCRTEDQYYKEKYNEFFADRAKFDIYKLEKYISDLQKKWEDQNASKYYSMPRYISNPMIDSFDATICATRPVLERIDTGETLEIKQSTFSIGRSAMDNDYAIEGDYEVSRKRHAIIKFDGRSYSIVDNHSHNGILIDGIPVPVGDEKKLKNNSIISIGKAKFVFHAPAGN